MKRPDEEPVFKPSESLPLPEDSTLPDNTPVTTVTIVNAGDGEIYIYQTP